MAVTINASTSAGLVQTADTSGVLALQTAGTTAISIDASQNVNFAGTAQRITGDFSNATVASRVTFQNSVINGSTNIQTIPNGTATNAGFIGINNSDPTNASFMQVAITNLDARFVSAITGTGTYLPMTFYTGGSERVRIDTAGITKFRGTGAAYDSTPGDGTSDALYLQVDSSAIAHIDSYAGSGSTTLAFGTNSGGGAVVERMRIDSSGNVLVGNSSQIWDERLSARNSANNVLAGFYAQSTSYTSSVIRVQAETAAGTGWYLFEGRAAAGSFQYGIRGNGTVATSDERRKKNVEPARSYLQDICSIPIVKYNWKTDEDNTPKELGWLAQDVQKVFPNMVVTHHDGPNDDQEVLLLKKEVFVPMLMKCIQEQQALITQLQADVAALKGASA
jgi:hypothetical protein